MFLVKIRMQFRQPTKGSDFCPRIRRLGTQKHKCFPGKKREKTRPVLDRVSSRLLSCKLTPVSSLEKKILTHILQLCSSLTSKDKNSALGGVGGFSNFSRKTSRLIK